MTEDVYIKSLELHKKNSGKLEIKLKSKLETKEDLSLQYTPGVAEVCNVIAKDPKKAYEYTIKKNSVAVISNGTAVLGLGNIGALASLPVMEGKAALFKRFANIDAYPICLDTQDPKKIVEQIKAVSPGFGGINLEDIKAPECFEIENELQDIGIPVMHDDQHGTAVVVLAGLVNALKVLNKKFDDSIIVISGAGAAGIAVAKLILTQNPKDIILCDTKGILSRDRTNLNDSKAEISLLTNHLNKHGTLADALKNSDVFIGVSAPNIVTEEMIKSMNKEPIVFAMSNPTPEIMPDEAKKGGAAVIGTGRSDFPNQINNVLAFPGIFRGALDSNAKKITEKMKLAAAYAIANSITPITSRIVPYILDKDVDVTKLVAEAVKKAA